MYNVLVDRLSAWPMASLKAQAQSSPTRVGYYLWHFPALSETFIQREVKALQRAGLRLHVFADAPDDRAFLDQGAQALMQETCYLLPADSKRLRAYKRRFFFKHPTLYLNLLLYTIGRRHSGTKELNQDLHVFHHAVYLAGCLQDQGIRHLHSPWANASAFSALIASRLAGIPYSVQARASADLYRTTSRYALTEKFENAKFILTNAQFNRAFIELYMNPNARVPLYTIYEGLDLTEFNVKAKRETLSESVRILSVARLIEEKGLVYLLQALKQLQDAHCSFHCEIVGAADALHKSNYELELKALWRELELQNAVTFVGALAFDEVLKKYADADIFVLPSAPAKNGGRDVTPNVLLEAMAMQLPVISTNMSGIPEMIEDGVSGMLVPPKNPRALAQALSQLIANAELRQRLGQNARRRVEERFDITKNMQPLVHSFQGTSNGFK